MAPNSILDQRESCQRVRNVLDAFSWKREDWGLKRVEERKGKMEKIPILVI